MTLEIEQAVATFSMTLPTALQSVSNLKEEDECSTHAELNKPVLDRQLCTWSWAHVMPPMGFRELCEDSYCHLHSAWDAVMSNYCIWNTIQLEVKLWTRLLWFFPLLSASSLCLPENSSFSPAFSQCFSKFNDPPNYLGILLKMQIVASAAAH